MPEHTPGDSASSVTGGARNRQPVSLIMTFYNECASVERFFEDLKGWSRLPDEIVMVDGGSTDGTQGKVRAGMAASPAPVRFIEAPQCNISEGRNLAVRHSQHEIIAVTDMGCRIDSHWLERIAAPLEADPEVMVAGGYYEPIHHTPIQHCFYYLTHKQRLTLKNFLPSSRSLAFRKAAWEAVGGYPEDMITGEDTLFDLRLRKAGMKEVIVQDAKVFWEARDSHRMIYRQYHRYARGAGKGLLQPRIYAAYIGCYLAFAVWVILALVVHPGFWLVLLTHFGAYSVYRIYRKPLVRQHLTMGNVLRCHGIILAIDTATVFGYFAGIKDRFVAGDRRFKPPDDRGEDYGAHWERSEDDDHTDRDETPAG